MSTLSAGVVEYVDCTFTELRPHGNESPLYDIKLHLMMRLQSWILGKVEHFFNPITPRSTLTQLSSVCNGPISGSNRTVQPFAKDDYYYKLLEILNLCKSFILRRNT